MNYKHSCVIDRSGAYQTLVLVLLEPDETGQQQENVQHYSLGEGERLIDAAPPSPKPFAGADGYINPRWDDSAWVEAATAEEITVWDELHPAPDPPGLSEMERIAVLEEEKKILSAQVDALSEQNDFQEELIVELAGVLYA